MELRSWPIIGGLFHNAPPNHIHNVVQNKLGHQFVRYFFYNFLYALRSKPSISVLPEYIETLDKEGIIEWSNFFSPKEWDEIKAEFDSIKSSIALKPYYNKENPGIKMGIVEISENSETYKLIATNKILNECAGHIVHRDVSKFGPSISYMVIKRDDNMEFDDDVENILHADTFYPTAKAFVYLSDITEANAPYIFAKKSHLISFKRALYEYNMSVRVAKLAKGKSGSIPKDAIVDRGGKMRNIITENQKNTLNVVETQFPGKANSVIMSNNRGFHRRGNFSKGAVREIILINYRYASTNLTRRIASRIYKLLSGKEA